MANGVMIKTNNGTYLMGNTQCSNGCWFDAEGCFNYCNKVGKDEDAEDEKDFLSQHQSKKLLHASTLIGNDFVNEVNWYKNKDNFIDIEIGIDLSQEYKN